jgi:hypothetical protein
MNAVSAKPRNPGLTPKLRKLALLMPEVMEGKMTLKAAMLKAGYAESSSNQQSSALGALRNNTRMQEALRKAGFTEEFIAEKIMDGLKATRNAPAKDKESDEEIAEEIPDHHARHKFLQTGAEMLDAFPAKKNINADVDIADLIKAQESSTQKT